jgi:chromosome segregation ATPase
MTQASSWFIRRMERGVAKREKKIAKLREKMSAYEAKHAAGKISRAKLEGKKQHIEANIRALSAKMNTYKGAIGKERRRLEGKLQE